MRKSLSRLVYLISLGLTISCQAPQSPASSIISSSSPNTQPSSQPTVLTAPPHDFPRSNQHLASGEYLGLGFVLNQLDDKGNGALIWALGEQIGQHFTAFKASTPITLGRKFPAERLTWYLDSQGNGQVFRQQLGGPQNNLLSNKTDIYVFNVINYQPQPDPLILSDMTLIKLQKDSAGNGWLITRAAPPENAPPHSPSTLPPAKAHRLGNYHLLAGEPKTLPTELSAADFLLDAEGNGFAIHRENPTDSKTALLLQRLERFASVGAPEKLADSGDSWYSSVENGQGLVYWPVYNEQTHPHRYDILQVSNYLPGSRLPGINVNQGAFRKSLILNSQGNGALLWQETSPQPGKNDPITTQFMQAVKAYQPGQIQQLFSSGDEKFSSLDIQWSPEGRGLAIWKQQPWASNIELFRDADQRLMVRALDNFLPTGEIKQLSENSQKSVDEISIKLNPQGHGLIAWIQYSPCEQAPCPLVRNIWTRAVYNYRIPEE